MTQMTPILVRMPPELLSQLDAARGDVPRAMFIRRACERAVMEAALLDPTGYVARRQYTYDDLSPEQQASSDRNAARYAVDPEVKAAARARQEAHVQVGPVARKPGAMLKKGKKS